MHVAVPAVGETLPEAPGATLRRVLKADRYAQTFQVELGDGRLAIHKRSVIDVPPGVRLPWAARRLAGREADHLERLADVRGVPELIARPDAWSFQRQWIDGNDVRELAEVPDELFPRLRELVAEIHARGVAYADLAKEDNVVVDAATGEPWLVDFQISIHTDSPLGFLVPRLQAADRYYVARHVRNRRPDQLTDEDRRLLRDGRGLVRRLHRTLVKKPYNLVTRRLVRSWSGAGEGRREDEPRGRRDRS